MLYHGLGGGGEGGLQERKYKTESANTTLMITCRMILNPIRPHLQPFNLVMLSAGPRLLVHELTAELKL